MAYPYHLECGTDRGAYAQHRGRHPRRRSRPKLSALRLLRSPTPALANRGRRACRTISINALFSDWTRRKHRIYVYVPNGKTAPTDRATVSSTSPSAPCSSRPSPSRPTCAIQRSTSAGSTSRASLIRQARSGWVAYPGLYLERGADRSGLRPGRRHSQKIETISPEGSGDALRSTTPSRQPQPVQGMSTGSNRSSRADAHRAGTGDATVIDREAPLGLNQIARVDCARHSCWGARSGSRGSAPAFSPDSFAPIATQPSAWLVTEPGEITARSRQEL